MKIIEFPQVNRCEKPPFETLYEQYFDQIVRYLAKRLGNIQDAEDLAGDVFLYCYKNYDQYDPERSAVSTWLYLVVNSRLKNHYRDRRDSADISELAESLFAEHVDMERAVYLEQLRDFLAGGLERLPERQRDIVVMRYFRQMEFADIAAELGITAGNARVILSRALEKLGKELQDSKLEWSVD